MKSEIKGYDNGSFAVLGLMGNETQSLSVARGLIFSFPRLKTIQQQSRLTARLRPALSDSLQDAVRPRTLLRGPGELWGEERGGGFRSDHM